MQSGYIGCKRFTHLKLHLGSILDVPTCMYHIQYGSKNTNRCALMHPSGLRATAIIIVNRLHTSCNTRIIDVMVSNGHPYISSVSFYCNSL